MITTIKTAAVCQSMKRNGGNRTKVAKELGIGIRTLFGYLKEMGVGRREAAPEPDLTEVLEYFDGVSKETHEEVCKSLELHKALNEAQKEAISACKGSVENENDCAYAIDKVFDYYLKQGTSPVSAIQKLTDRASAREATKQ